MSQYNVFTGQGWVNAAVVGPKGETGPYYKPSLEKGYLSMENSETKEIIELGSILGPQGDTGYGYNANLLTNWDFAHPIRRASGDNLICDRWFRTSSDLKFEFYTNPSTNSSSLKLTTDSRHGIKQHFPYISPGNYIFSIVTNNSSNTTFNFKILDATGKEKGSWSDITVLKSKQPASNARYIHYATATLSEELLPSGTNYPSIVISVIGENVLLYRAKMEINIYKDKELFFPTIEQEVMQDEVFTKLAINNSNSVGVYTSPFIYISNTIVGSSWEEVEGKGYYEVKFTREEAKRDCHLIVTSHPDSFIEWSEYNIICSNHDPSTGKITMRAVDKPSEDIKVNILVVKY